MQPSNNTPINVAQRFTIVSPVAAGCSD